MPIINVRLNDLAGFVRRSMDGKVKAAVKAIQQTVATEGLRILQEEVDATQPRAPVDVGTYRRGFQAVMEEGGAVLINPTLHAAIVELGRRPGARMPPPDALVGWVKRHLVPRGKNREAIARGLAFVVARKIKERGLPPKRVMARAEPRVTAAVDRVLAEIAGRP